MERIDAILMADNPIKDPANPTPLPTDALNGKTSIQFKDVCFSYDGERPVIDHVDLTVEPGQTVAIVGQSGSGKSTRRPCAPILGYPRRTSVHQRNRRASISST